MPIRVLSDDVATKIAAGEVVERPASVVKELVENSIDAGSSVIGVEVRQGGRRLIRVSDNGGGIAASELALAFARHATSKIVRMEVLDSVRTLGFRGEALASVGAVANVTLVSRPPDQEVGCEIRFTDGVPGAVAGRGIPAGTIVTVEHLFHSVPARLKFLRADSTENARVTEVVTRYAMAYPAIRFALTVDGRTSFQSPGSGDMRDVLVKVFGAEVASALVELDSVPDTRTAEAGDVRVRGLVGPIEVSRASRDYMAFFVNRRWIQDRSLSFAVVQAYHGLLPVGRYPIAVVLLEVDPADVDVNVHPTKAEVRFREGGRVFAQVQRLVRRTVLETSPIPGFSLSVSSPDSVDWERRRALLAAGRGTPISSQFALEVQRTGDGSLPPSSCEPATPGLPPLRVLGQLGRLYIIGEGPDGLYLIDQHAAHERVLYDQIAAAPAGRAASQQLLGPMSVELTAHQAAVLDEALPRLAELGFGIERFGADSCLVRAVPVAVSAVDVPRMLRDALDELGLERPPTTVGDRTTAVVACHAAVREGQVLAHEEMQGLIRQLERTAMPRTCPHGRPTVLHLSMGLLEREFRR